MSLSKIQVKNKIDKPTIVESLKELAILSAIVGALYFLGGVQDVGFGVYDPIIVATARVLIKLLEEIKKGE